MERFVHTFRIRLYETERSLFWHLPYEPKKDAQVIRVRGRQPHEFFNLNYLYIHD